MKCRLCCVSMFLIIVRIIICVMVYKIKKFEGENIGFRLMGGGY